MIAVESYQRGGERIAWGFTDRPTPLDEITKWRAVLRPLLLSRWLLAINEGPSLDDIELDESYEPMFYDRGYEYEDGGDALLAFVTFTGGEPLDGWTRAYPPRFRRRPTGDPASEEVRP